MSDWMLGYLKGATQRNEAATADAWKKVIAALGEPPAELEDLYSQSDGLVLAGNVTLYPLVTPTPSVLSVSQQKSKGAAHAKAWRFGIRGEQELFAVRKSDLATGDGVKIPSWLRSLPDNGWVWGRWSPKQDERLYSTLETLLEVLVPPTETEEFGEATFARALQAVERAVGSLPKSGTAKGKGSPKKGR